METSERAERKVEVKHSSLPWFNDKSTRTIRSVPNMRAWQRHEENQKHFVIAKYPMRDANYPISHEEWEANGDFIVTACNSYEHLKEVNAELLDMLKEIAEELDNHHDIVDGEDGKPKPNWAMNLQSDIDMLVAKAEASK